MPYGPRRHPIELSLLRVSAAIAVSIAIAGCDKKIFEAGPLRYSVVEEYAEMDFGYASDLAKQALSDGFLTNAEYLAVVDAAKEEREARQLIEKDKALQAQPHIAEARG